MRSRVGGAKPSREAQLDPHLAKLGERAQRTGHRRDLDHGRPRRVVGRFERLVRLDARACSLPAKRCRKTAIFDWPIETRTCSSATRICSLPSPTPLCTIASTNDDLTAPPSAIVVPAMSRHANVITRANLRSPSCPDFVPGIELARALLRRGRRRTHRRRAPRRGTSRLGIRRARLRHRAQHRPRLGSAPARLRRRRPTSKACGRALSLDFPESSVAGPRTSDGTTHPCSHGSR